MSECLLSFGAESFVFQFATKNLQIEIYRTIIFPVVYGCETWLLTLKEEHRLRIFENNLLRIFGCKRNEVIEKWRKPNEELNLYPSPNIVWVMKSRRMRWVGHVMYMGERRSIYRVLVEIPEGKRPFGRPRYRWEDNIKMDLQELGCGDMDWFKLAQDRDRWWVLVNVVMNLQVP